MAASPTGEEQGAGGGAASSPPSRAHPDPAPSAAGIAGDRPVVLAAIIGAHGVTGEVRLKLFGDGPESLKRYKSLEAGGRALTLKSVRPGPNGAVARFIEITDRSAAEALRGVELSVPRSALPALEEGEYYHADLIGLPCETDDGASVGAIVAVENFGAGDIIEIEKPGGKRFMVAIHAARIEAHRVLIDAAFVD